MHELTTSELSIFLVVLGSALILARILFKTLRYIPSLVAELLVGIVLGPTVLGYVFPEMHQVLFPEGGQLQTAYSAIIDISIVMLLFMGGMEIDFDLLTQDKKGITITSIFAIIIPMIVGVWVGHHFSKFFHGFTFSAAPYAFSLVFGTIVSISALPVIIRILMDLNVLNTHLGVTVVGTALVTDLVGWLAFSSTLIYVNPTLENIQIIYTVVYILIFFLIMFVLSSSKEFMNKLFAQPVSQKSEVSYDISMLFGVCLLAGAFTNAIHIHPSLGAFIAGIVCKRIIGDKAHIAEQLKTFIMNFFAPIFFISIGLRLNFLTELNIPMVLAFFGLACLIKIVGGTLGAYLSKFSWHSSLAIGFTVNARGAMEIIMGAIALKIGLIGDQLFVCIVITSIVTCLMAQPIVARILKKEPDQSIS